MQDLEVLGERALLYAMIERAALDATGNVGFTGGVAPTVAKIAARAWISCWRDAESAPAFSFPWVCIYLDLDPYEMKSKLRALYRAKNVSLVRSSFEWKSILEHMCTSTANDGGVYY
jgi:hypothetical protein